MEDIPLRHILSAEWLKIKRTPVSWLVFVTPAVFAALIVWYFSLKTVTPDMQISVFQAFFESWSVLVIPMGAGLISGFIIYQEELAGGFNGFLGNNIQRSRLYLGKLTLLILLTTTSILLAVLSLGVGLTLLTHIPVAWPIYIMAALMVQMATLPLLAFHLWTSLAWGMGASVGFGGGGILIAALTATSLGDKVWQFVMWGWPVRLSRLPGSYLLYLPKMKTPPDIISSGYPLYETITGTIPVIVLFILLLIGGMIWFQKWEGRKVYH